MDHEVSVEARVLRDRFGSAALAECSRRLEDATAARDYRAGVLWAEVHIRLRAD